MPETEEERLRLDQEARDRYMAQENVRPKGGLERRNHLWFDFFLKSPSVDISSNYTSVAFIRYK